MKLNKYKNITIKFSIFFAIFFAVMMSGYSVEYLNSCGKNSGWTDNETYILNFTEVPGTYPNNYCFSFPNDIFTNLTFQGTGDIIDLTNADVRFFLHDGFGTVSNSFYKDIKILYADNNNNLRFFALLQDGNGAMIQNSVFENILMINGEGGFHLTDNARIIDNNFSNVTFLNYHREFLEQFGGSQFQGNVFDNAFFHGDRFFRNSLATNSKNNVTDSIIINTGFHNPVGANLETGAEGSGGNRYWDTLISNYPHNDSDDNNLADSQLYDHVYDAPITKTRKILDKEYIFMQDVDEGSPFFTTGNFVTIRNENTSSPNILALATNQVFDSSLVDLELDSGVFNIQASGTGSGFFCQFSILTGNPTCNIDITSNSIIGNGTKFKPMISVASSNHTFYQLNVDKLPGSKVDSQILANQDDTFKSDINISESIFTAQNGTIGASNLDSRHIIKLKANNVDIHDNLIQVFNSDNTSIYEMLYLEATNPRSNNVYLNDFDNLITNPNSDSVIFTYSCDTDFYNNIVGEDVVVSNGCSSGLNVTPLIGYLHTDGKVYYYRVGNYYEDNTGCTDSDSDGFCDSDYNSGTVTDTNPLSSHPFDYSAHLFTAENVVDSTEFNITLTQPSPGQVFNLANSSDSITFGFNHDSEFTDLTCDYIIDGSAVSGATVTNTDNSTHTASFTGWSSQNYSYRVECYNDFSNEVSNEIIFTVNVAGTNGTNGGGDNETNGGGDNGNGGGISDTPDYSFTGLFSSDISETGDSVVDLFKIFEQPIGYGFVIGFIMLFAGLIAVVISLLWMFLHW